MSIFSTSGALEIHLDRPSIAPGESLMGNITVALDERLAGCTLNIELIGHVRRNHTSAFRHRSKSEPWRKSFQLKDTLLENATVEAPRAMHPFELRIPAELGVVEMNLPKNALGSMAETFLENVAASMEYRWKLYARLVIPGMFNDLKADIPVQIDIPEDRIR